MKKGHLMEGILFVLGGAALLCIELLTHSMLGSLLVGFAAGGICSGIVMIGKYIYWSAPKNRERYRQKMEDEEIQLHDELKSMLRDKSGRYSYAIGMMTLCISIVAFSILGKLGIIDNPRIIVLYLSSYLVFQIILGIVIFKHLLKKYE